jgi:anaerobic magnesium-protoporphyrin IX monomethyl ester cyclase
LKKLDVLFVTPPSRLEVYQGLATDLAAIEPPVWSGLMAAFLENRGVSVGIIDAEAEGYSHEQTAKAAADMDASLVVFVIYGQQPSASTQCMPGGTKTCRLFNEVSDSPTMAMGTHPSALPKRTLEEEPYTYVCQGEGPLTVEALVNVLKNGGDLSAVPGLWYRDGDGVVASTPQAEKLKDLDVLLPRQAWELLDMSKYRAHNWHSFHDLDSRGSYASLQTSLGCPYKCSFCCINTPFGGAGIRYWSPENVIAQIDELVTKYGVRNIKIPDEMFVLNKNHVIGICDYVIERGYDLNFWAYARIDTIQDRFLEKLKKAGFNWLGIGIESASKHVRDDVTKGRFGDTDIIATVEKVREHGIAVAANYIFGLPEDDEASMRETLDLALHLNTEWANFYSAMAYPGSELYQVASQNKWALPSDPGGIGWIGYSQHAYDCQPLPTNHLKGEDVLDFRDAAFDEYFNNPSYLAMIDKTYGPKVRGHISEMAAHTLKRKHHA